MNIGILLEDKNEEPIKILTERIVKENQVKGFKKIDFFPHSANGPIIGVRKEMANYFFELFDCDFAVFHCDCDKSKKNKINKLSKIKKLKKLKEEIYKKNGWKIALALPDPTFEEWLLIDDSILKKLLKLTDRALPFKKEIKHPKKLIEKIIKSYNKDVTLTKSDIYKNIAEKMNLEIAYKNCASFRNFFNEIKEILNNGMG